MPANPKLFIHGWCYEICFRTQSGLPFVPTVFMCDILNGILAKAQSLYPIEICHLVWMNNHIHMIVRCISPDAVDDFVCYTKRESAHAANRLLGRKLHTVWQEGYDSVPILDSEKMLARIAYLYLNPARADLETSIELYPHISSWKAFKRGGTISRTYKRVARNVIPVLPRRILRTKEQCMLAEKMLEESSDENTLTLTPDSWLQAFPDTRTANAKTIRERLRKEITAAEMAIARSRKSRVVGARALVLGNMRAKHTPKERRPRSICFASTRDLRLRYIQWFKELCREKSILRSTLTRLEYLRALPAGMFAPGGALHASINPKLVPF